MPRRLDFHPDAEDEIYEAQEWYARQSHSAARRFVVAVDNAVEELRRNPERGPQCLFGTQRWMVWRFPYLIVYRDSGTAIRILAVAHSRRNPGYWRHRLTDE